MTAFNAEIQELNLGSGSQPLSLLSQLAKNAAGCLRELCLLPLYCPKMPYILTVSRSLVFKDVFFFLEELYIILVYIYNYNSYNCICIKYVYKFIFILRIFLNWGTWILVPNSGYCYKIWPALAPDVTSMKILCSVRLYKVI